MMKKHTCIWPGNDELMIRYHDEEWGVPVYDDAKHFEFIVLDTFQAGLSWKTILHKRENFRKAFDKFQVKKIAKYNEDKIRATVSNAQAFMAIQKEFGDFNSYIWQFVGNQPKVNRIGEHKLIPASTPESDAMSKDLYKRGFKFVGSTICYAYMQAAGMVNDHLHTCFRHAECRQSIG